jgi:excisionase family DNA binding protein
MIYSQTMVDDDERPRTRANARGQTMAPEKYLTVQDVASQLSVHPDTVRKWIKTGELEAIPLGGTAGYRITQTAVDKFIKERKDRFQQDR